jgi:glycosyltransferase involved in cell wall biosynthesis
MKKNEHPWRVLFVESYPHVIFGQQKTLLTLLQKCASTPLENVVGVTADGPFVNAVQQQIGCEVIRFEYPALLANYGGAVYRYRGLRQLFFGWQVLKYIARIRRILKEKRIKGVFCNDMRGLLTVGIAARCLGIPVMIWDKLDRPHGWLDWLQLPLANKVAFIAEAVKVKFPAWQLKYYRNRLSIVPEGADVAIIDAIQALKRSELGIKDEALVVAIVGSITPRKGLDRVLAILPALVAQIPNALLLIIGSADSSDEDQAYLQNIPNRSHQQAIFLGFREDVLAIMHAIDILVIPSRQEGMGLVVVEAMACHKPVVGARTGGIQEVIVDGETGILFYGDDSEQLLAALIKLAGSAELRKKMGQAGRERVEKYYDRSIQMGKIINLLTELVATQ